MDVFVIQGSWDSQNKKFHLALKKIKKIERGQKKKERRKIKEHLFDYEGVIYVGALKKAWATAVILALLVVYTHFASFFVNSLFPRINPDFIYI